MLSPVDKSATSLIDKVGRRRWQLGLTSNGADPGTLVGSGSISEGSDLDPYPRGRNLDPFRSRSPGPEWISY